MWTPPGSYPNNTGWGTLLCWQHVLMLRAANALQASTSSLQRSVAGLCAAVWGRGRHALTLGTASCLQRTQGQLGQAEDP